MVAATTKIPRTASASAGNGRPAMVYMDHSATTPVDPAVRDAMLPFLDEGFGNPSGAYRPGRRARSAMEEARGTVAGILGCAPAEVVFTSGGTESDNLALRGACAVAGREGRGRHLVVSAIEHKAVLATAHELEEAFGCGLTIVAPDAEGRVDPAAVLAAVRDDTCLVSLMLANNEVGTLQPVAEVGAALQARGIPFHTDAVQGGPWLDLDVGRLHVDMLSLSAHKFYGPKGVGALYVRAGTPVTAVQTGGGQEHGLRCGTENVAGIVGLATALDLAQGRRSIAAARASALRDAMLDRLAALPGVRVTGSRAERLPGHVSLTVAGVPANVLLLGLDMQGICASSGSACSAGRNDPSHVLTAMGVDADEARGALRLTMGHHTDEAQAEAATAALGALIPRARRVLAD